LAAIQNRLTDERRSNAASVWHTHVVDRAANAPVLNYNSHRGSPIHAGPDERHQALANRLYVLVAATHPSFASRITGMLLESLDLVELIEVVNDSASLNSQIQMALKVMQIPNCLPRHVEEILKKEAERYAAMNGCCIIFVFN
jgi:hypothetical protein